ncbi:MAG TPA: hypothetical protein VNM37_29535, partial [Candidatus Dormibacteraeota bacterium]|nr:hypothetical protein [Candidatus Dormibacteraeota bacterium]
MVSYRFHFLLGQPRPPVVLSPGKFRVVVAVVGVTPAIVVVLSTPKPALLDTVLCIVRRGSQEEVGRSLTA